MVVGLHWVGRCNRQRCVIEFKIITHQCRLHLFNFSINIRAQAVLRITSSTEKQAVQQYFRSHGFRCHFITLGLLVVIFRFQNMPGQCLPTCGNGRCTTYRQRRIFDDTACAFKAV